jgi:Ni/Fe-hydrogenase 1 B-type cytochrome subunit
MSAAIPSFSPVDVARNPQDYYRAKYVWEWPVRLTHWVNAASVTVLFLTGLYISHPVLAPSGEAYNHFVMGRVRQIHFATALIFLVSFLLRIYWFYMGNNYARSGFPFVWRRDWWRDLVRQAGDYFKLHRGHIHLGHNALGGLAYTFFVIGLGWAQIFTGLALYSESNPSGWLNKLVGWVIPLLGGSFQTHMWHHLFAWGFVVFAILHIYIVLYDSYQYRNGLITSMISGLKFYQEGDIEQDKWLG